MSDIYSFGVVLLELLTGRRSVDKSRSAREQNLVEWARPMLNDSRKLARIMDPKLEGQYSESGAKTAAALAYQCLSNRPKSRPTMSTVVKTLEPLQDYQEIPIGTFVFTVPPDNTDNSQKECEAPTPKERKKESSGRHHQSHRSNGHSRRHHQHPLRSPKSPSDRSRSNSPPLPEQSEGHAN
ncbi:hypothetical protein L6164_011816 [Bauhinia variegata]|nr:hypothetical protein L6164_011816 [Bauhinia variegata]